MESHVDTAKHPDAGEGKGGEGKGREREDYTSDMCKKNEELQYLCTIITR